MKQLILVMLLTIATSALNAGDAAAGKTKSMICSTCHGAEGVSIAPNWPNLAGQHASYLKKQITEFKAEKRVDQSMAPMVANLTEQDIADLAAYYASLENKPVAVKENFVALGAEIYTRGAKGVTACTGCHGPQGNGLAAAGFPAVTGQKVEYAIKQLKDFRDGTRTNDMNGMMRDVAKAMTDEQIEAVANYVSGLH